jgi:hypothetical protein
MYSIPVLLSGSTNSEMRSGSDTPEDHAYFFLDLIVAPAGVTIADAGGRDSPGGAAKLLRDLKLPLWRHRAEDFDGDLGVARSHS